MKILNNKINSINETNLKVVDIVFEVIRNSGRQWPKYLDLLSIFFNDIVFIITGYIILADTLSNKPGDEYLLLLKTWSSTKFPYIDYNDVVGKFDLDNKRYNDFEVSLTQKNRLFNIFNKANSFLFRKKTVCISTPLSVNLKSLIKELFFKYNLAVIFSGNERISIPYLSEQQNLINEVVHRVKDLFQDKQEHFEAIRIIITNHILKFVDQKEPNELKGDILIVGPMAKINNNILAAKARFQGKPVITVSHGDGDQLLFDEPKFGYSERSFPTHYFGYGPAGKDSWKNSQHMRLLYDEPEYFCSNSDFIRKIYSGSKIKSIDSLGDKTIMYVPDSLQFCNRYGPFGSISEPIYLSWQNSLTKAFPGIIFKKHVKGAPLHRQLKSKDYIELMGSDIQDNCKFWYDDFKDCYKKCDVYFFDHIGTAFMIAVATDKPVVYFNIGKRYLNPFAEKCIRERCIWIDIDPENHGDLHDLVCNRLSEPKTNSISKYFSLDPNNNNITRSEQLAELANQILNTQK